MICVSISEPSIKEASEVIKKSELAEIRLDLTKWDTNQIKEVFSIFNNLIVTMRPLKDVSESEREARIISAIESGAKYVDIEIESSSIFKQKVSTAAKEHGCDVIISYHNYTETPTEEDLKKIIDDCFIQGADVAKVATQVNHIKDVARILGLYDTDKRIVALGMGEIGKITRVISLNLGAEFSFASMDNKHATAPGQLTQKQMKEYLKYIKQFS